MAARRTAIVVPGDADGVVQTAAMQLRLALGGSEIVTSHEATLRSITDRIDLAIDTTLPMDCDAYAIEPGRIAGATSRGVLQGVFGFLRGERHVRRAARFPLRAAMPYFSEAGALTDDLLRDLLADWSHLALWA